MGDFVRAIHRCFTIHFVVTRFKFYPEHFYLSSFVKTISLFTILLTYMRLKTDSKLGADKDVIILFSRNELTEG